jgi:hypothetical protein
MANKDTVFGARITGNLYSSTYSGRVRSYTVPATDAVALFVGDFVKLTGTSGVGQDGKSRQVVTQGTAATDVPIVGIVVGFEVDSSNLNSISRAASTLRTVRVCDDPYVMFEIQTSGAALTAAMIGTTAQITVGSGSTITGLSGMEVDVSTLYTNGDGQIRLVDLSPREDNDYGLNGKAICMISRHRYKELEGK